MKRKNSKKGKSTIISLIAVAILILVSVYQKEIITFINRSLPESLALPEYSYSMDNIPEYAGKNYVIIDDNEPKFDDDDKKTESFENYSELDVLERCGVAYANISREIMPTEERGSIGNVKPSGWQTIKYDNIDGKYLYNRCHLIGYQLAGENANPKNLITCTRQMNTIGMLDFENQVSNYVKKTNNHVLYRVTPIFKDNELVARGVQIEALSVEDNGKGIKFNVFVYNVQNGIEIDYNTGNSKLIENKEN